MGARLSRLITVVVPPSMRPAAVTPTATLATSDNTLVPATLKPPAKRLARNPPVYSIPPSLTSAEATLIHTLTETAYTKRLITLPSGLQLNTLSCGHPTSPTLVILHGWGAGSAFFAQNLCTLSKHHRVHLIDWPGFAASHRPPFDMTWSPTVAESFFTDALDAWANAMPKYESTFPTSFHVAAHSLGAYLAVVYALRAPRRVRTLVLASPVGVPKAPPSNQRLPTTLPLPARLLLRLLFMAWDYGLTPQMAIRICGRHLGRRLADSIISPRLVSPSPQTRAAITEYFYQISSAPCSGELSLCTILQSGAYARQPLCDRLPLVRMPVTFLYGDRDWMNVQAARDACERMSVPTEVITVPDAGHHVYFDNVDFFDTAVINACAKSDALFNAAASQAEAVRTKATASA